MPLRRARRSRLGEDVVDPMSGVANLIDVMLVFACGLMVALVLSWNLQNVLFSKATPKERQQMLQAIQKAVNVQKGREMKELPKVETGGGAGYQEMGTVYRDPKTGKLIMIEQEKSGGE
ncbi:DUF2149 domain-containing protein [Thermincola potens]|uniref:DUF2149 domain-containing protein n=1 Tax=Thermincola potens (strain JR) TaxID=635013 RepID=D5XEP4_THEPJ|nr:DUF2149 domain-containing protein [Thermincola potens]ADG82115.1 Protein of unknown function DUF2149 [Thermincola potens JR]